MLLADKIVLGIETAFGGGSISVFRKNVELCSLSGKKNSISRSEEILSAIDLLFAENGLNRKEIGLIAVSNGLGSFTGMRIGLALARGLRRVTGCRLVGVSVLEALGGANPPGANRFVAVAYSGHDVFWTYTSKKESGQVPQKTSLQKFIEKVLETDGSVLCNRELRTLLLEKQTDLAAARLTEISENLAFYLCKWGSRLPASDKVLQKYTPSRNVKTKS